MELIPGAMSMIELTRIEVAGERTLDLTFSDGARGRRSAAATIARATVLTRPLEDPAYFARAFIEAGPLPGPTAGVLGAQPARATGRGGDAGSQGGVSNARPTRRYCSCARTADSGPGRAGLMLSPSRNVPGLR